VLRQVQARVKHDLRAVQRQPGNHRDGRRSAHVDHVQEDRVDRGGAGQKAALRQVGSLVGLLEQPVVQAEKPCRRLADERMLMQYHDRQRGSGSG
jgi:hypothetical protein